MPTNFNKLVLKTILSIIDKHTDIYFPNYNAPTRKTIESVDELKAEITEFFEMMFDTEQE